MSDIATTEPNDLTLAGGPVSELAVWAMDARQAHLVAQSLAATSFVPNQFKGKPDEITAAILTGQEVGLKPMASLRSIVVIQGTPAMTAVAQRGLVQAHGHEVWVRESTSTRAVVCGRRRGTEQVQESVWDRDRAQQLGLTSKDNYRKQPGAMFVARASAEVCRLIASDVLLGLPYAVEELTDDIPSEPLTPAAKAKATRTAKRAAAAPVVHEEPSLEEPMTGGREADDLADASYEEPSLHEDEDDS